MRYIRIFISYTRLDYDKVEIIYRKLSDFGFKPWIDKIDILPGENWEYSTKKAIQDSDFFIVCLSKNSINKRGIIQKEIKIALDTWQEMLEDDIYLIPVRLEDCIVPENIKEFNYVNIFEERGWNQLVNAINVGMERREITAIFQETSDIEIFIESYRCKLHETILIKNIPHQILPLRCTISRIDKSNPILFDLLTKIGSHRYIFIIGEPGSGKTTMLKLYADKLLKNKSNLPIFIPLSLINLEMLENEIVSRLSFNKNINITELSEKYKFYLLLDGLDEVLGTKHRILYDQILKLIQIFPINQVVVTCRTASHPVSGWANFLRLKICPLERSEVVKELSNATSKDLSILKRILFTSIGNLVRIPLFLTMVVRLLHENLLLPNDLSSLYGAYIDFLLREHEYHDPLEISKSGLINVILRRCAYEMTMNETVWIGPQKLINIAFEEAMKMNQDKPYNILYDIIHSEIMRRDSLSRLSFSHRSFQEFFTALFLSEENDIDNINFSPLFPDVPLFLSNMRKDATKIVRKARKISHQTASQCIRVAKQIESSIVDEVLRYGLNRYIENRRGPSKKINEVSDLEAFGVWHIGERALKSLLTILKGDINPQMRAMAVFALSENEKFCKQEEAQRNASEVLKKEKNFHCIYHILDYLSLHHFNSQEVWSIINNINLEKDQIANAYKILFIIHREKRKFRKNEHIFLVKTLSEVLNESPGDFEKKHHALDLIGHFVIKELHAIDCKYLKFKDEWMLRSRAAKALQYIGNIDDVNTLISCFSDPDADVRYCSLRSLYQLGRGNLHNIESIIRNLLENEPSTYILSEGLHLVDKLRMLRSKKINRKIN